MIDIEDFIDPGEELAFIRGAILLALLGRIGETVRFSADELDYAARRLYEGKSKVIMKPGEAVVEFFVEHDSDCLAN